ncbi:phage terminase small subunit P27 family [Pseudoalteromonas piratica]|jgi:P27 family predicted phage terminase small subunit|uniref:Terminase n=1 Tax=Pseudoalteromonas piratica TaxID=1348114 RepID=A0A0A7EF78_9GAMM|nr:phage terminase small subunit P27 family [Pseudoalteromonas piratica]AIY65188.1 terminase [Pseudoalteromonas piratica]
MTAVRSPGAGRAKGDLAVGDAEIKRVAPPPELINEMAKECWKTNSKILIKRNSYAQEDAILLLAYCNAFAMMLQCDQELAGTYWTESGQGGLKKHPLVNVRNDAISQLTRTGSLLGLNPMSRARMLSGGKSEDEENEFDEF